eukprot:jgi/Psemu1/57913/gm1.57913_g
MMEEIDFSDTGTTPNAFGDLWETDPSRSSGNLAATGSTIGSSATQHRASDTDRGEPLRLPRIGGSLGNRATFFRNTIQSQISIPTQEQLRKRTQKAGKAFKNLGSQLNKINLGKLIDQMEQDQGLADSLDALNSRMKEEVERHQVRREAEELSLRVITDHLDGFLEEHPEGTYEEWISDLHPENANQGKLLSDIQQIDERFYVMESDHRRMWNTAIEEQHGKEGNSSSNNNNNNGRESYAHRLVEARTQIWGKAPGASATPSNLPPTNGGGFSDNSSETGTPAKTGSAIDLLSGSMEFPSTTKASAVPASDDQNGNGIEEIDFFAPIATYADDGTGGPGTTQSDKTSQDPFDDLLKF